MTEELKLKEVIATGKGADEWLNHPQFRHVVTLIKAELVSQFESTKFKDTAERDEIWRKLQSLNGIVNRMERLIRDGKTAEKTWLERFKDKIRG